MNRSSFTTEECLRDLSQKPSRSDIIKKLSEFVGVVNKTVAKWLNGKRMPNGENLLKLRYFLDQEGYQVSELLDLDKDIREFGRFVAVGKITLDSAYKLLKFTHRDTILDLLLGRQNTSREKILLIQKYLDSEIFSSEYDKDAIIRATASNIQALDSLVGLVLSDSFTAEDRAKIRQLAGSDTVFRTSNSLNRLCGETARRKISQKEEIPDE
ncbi:hypothetical protein ACFL14_01085 [Patescibacteria group bacterium]